MKTSLIILAAAIGVAGCNASPTVTATNASASDVAQKMKDAKLPEQLISPGKWEATMTIDDIAIPGMPPQAVEKMKAQMAQQRTHTSCLTAEDVKRPKEQFFAQLDKSCRYDHFTMGNGKIDAVLHCAQAGAKRTMTVAGTYAPDTYHMSVTTKGDADKSNPMAGMSMRMEMNAKRTGECSASDKQRSGA